MRPNIQGQRVDSRRKNSVKPNPEERFCACGQKLSTYNRGSSCYQCEPLRKHKSDDREFRYNRVSRRR